VSLSAHLRTDTDPVYEMLCSLVTLNSGRWTKSRNPEILSVNKVTLKSIISVKVDKANATGCYSTTLLVLFLATQFLGFEEKADMHSRQV
jgi:hypothetical protein